MYIGSINDRAAYLKIKFRTPIEISYMECNFRCTNGSGNSASSTGGNITINYVACNISLNGYHLLKCTSFVEYRIISDFFGYYAFYLLSLSSKI